MKNLLFTLLCLCCLQTGFSQNPPCMADVWPTDYNNGVTTLTAYDSSAFAVTSYLWSTGATTPSIDVSDEEEVYCVTITYANGCVASACDTLSNDYCWSYASTWHTAAGGSVVSVSSAPYHLDATYLWSNGSAAQNFVTHVSGTYCVTVTLENGCTSTACVDVQAPTPNCTVLMGPGEYENGVTTFFIWETNAGNISSYLWSTGETTPEIDVAADGNYCVTVTYNDGCIAADCFTLNTAECSAYATAAPTAVSYFVSVSGFPYHLDATYLWSNGSTAQNFTTDVPGTYCVTVTRENGCTSTACATVPVVNPPNPSCYVEIVPMSYDTGITTLSAIDSILNINTTYLWSSGQTTSTINVTSEGVYCVTVTNPNGCTTSTCYTLTNDNCVVYINSGLTPSGFVAYAVHSPSYLDATYLWSNGETTSGIAASLPGTYCVTMTAENGCSAVECVEVELNNEVNIYVQHADSLVNGIFAQVYLIQYDEVNGVLSAPLMLQTDANGYGHAQFSDVAPGQYLVKAAVIPGTVGFNELLPTYHYSALLWNDATYVNVPASGWVNKVIIMIPGNNPGGPGFIGGLVSEGANFTGGHTQAEFSGEGDPIAGASIILTLPDGTPVAAATTQADGTYSFPSLAYGTYVVTINIPGIEPVSTTITLTPNQPGFSGINFDVTQGGATLAAKEVAYEAFAKVSPNPTSDLLQVDLIDTEGMLLLTNMQGQVISRKAIIASRMNLSLATLPAGTYLLTAVTAKGSKSVQVVKQ